MALLSVVSIVAMVMLLIAAPAQGLIHLLMIVVRRFRAQPLRPDWQVISRLAIILAALGMIALFFALGDVGSKLSIAVQRVIVTTFLLSLIACIAIPVWYLVSAYRKSRGQFRIATYAIALVSLLAMPAVATFINSFSVAATDIMTGRQLPHNFVDLDTQRYIRQPPGTSPCFQFLTQLNMKLGSDMPDEDNINTPIDFWFDQTLSGAFFDGAEVFDCHLSNLTNNPTDVAFSGIIILYRLFAEIILVGVMIWPFVPLIRRIRRGTPEHDVPSPP